MASRSRSLPLTVAYIGSHVARADVPGAHLGAAHENVKLHTSDGLDLDGWYVPSRNGAAVIVFPGRSGTRSARRGCSRATATASCSTTAAARAAARATPTAGAGTSTRTSAAGLAFLKHRTDVDPRRIGGLGLSVGAEMLLQTAGADPDLAAVVSEGAGARTMGEEVDDVAGPLEKAGAALTYGIRDLTNSVLQNRRPPANLITLIPKIAPRPIFFIHAGADEAGHLNPAYFRAAGEPKQIWEARGGHTQGIDKDTREYERRVTAFLDGSL